MWITSPPRPFRKKKPRVFPRGLRHEAPPRQVSTVTCVTEGQPFHPYTLPAEALTVTKDSATTEDVPAHCRARFQFFSRNSREVSMEFAHGDSANSHAERVPLHFRCLGMGCEEIEYATETVKIWLSAS